MPAKSKMAVARLEMAGGEFCGNATRALAALLNRKKSFLLEISGLRQMVRVQASRNMASITLPIKSLRLTRGILVLPGITHILEPDKVIDKRKAKALLRANNLLRKDAAGVIGYKKIMTNLYTITPVVWVRDIKTLISETACASGTIALAYSCWRLSGEKTLRIKQPSGAVFETKINNTEITISGPINKIIKSAVTVDLNKDRLSRRQPASNGVGNGT